MRRDLTTRSIILDMRKDSRLAGSSRVPLYPKWVSLAVDR